MSEEYDEQLNTLTKCRRGEFGMKIEIIDDFLCASTPEATKCTAVSPAISDKAIAAEFVDAAAAGDIELLRLFDQRFGATRFARATAGPVAPGDTPGATAGDTPGDTAGATPGAIPGDTPSDTAGAMAAPHTLLPLAAVVAAAGAGRLAAAHWVADRYRASRVVPSVTAAGTRTSGSPRRDAVLAFLKLAIEHPAAPERAWCVAAVCGLTPAEVLAHSRAERRVVDIREMTREEIEAFLEAKYGGGAPSLAEQARAAAAALADRLRDAETPALAVASWIEGGDRWRAAASALAAASDADVARVGKWVLSAAK